MGGGASRAKRRKNGKAEELGTIAGLTPALVRRRRVLFGSANPQPFEHVAAELQFTEFPGNHRRTVERCVCGSIFMDDSPVCRKCGIQRPISNVELSAKEGQSEDLVFDRLGLPVANEFRQRAREICSIDHQLGPHAIELLGLGLDTGSALSTRFYKMGQVGKHIAPLAFDVAAAPPPPAAAANKDARKALTCYELLALFSVIRGGSRDELLELLFCLFDVDEDDKVSAKDFEATIVSYLEAEGEIGLDRADLDAYRRVTAKDKTMAARRVAELAVAKYGSGIVELPQADSGALSEGEEPTSHPKGNESAEDQIPKPAAKKKGGRSCLCSGKQPASDSERTEKNSSKGKDVTEQKAKPSKALLDEDSEGSGYSSDECKQHKKGTKSTVEKKEEPAPKKKSRFTSWSPRRSKQDAKKKDTEKPKEIGPEKGKEPNKADGAGGDTGIESSPAYEGGKQLTQAKDPNGAKPTTSRAAPKRSKSSCCPVCRGKPKSTSGPKKDVPPLTFEQWVAWFNDNFAEFVLPEAQTHSHVLTRGDTILEEPAKMARGGDRVGTLGQSLGDTSGVKQFRAPGDEDDSNPDNDLQDLSQSPFLMQQS